MEFRQLFTAKTLRFISVTILLGAVGSGAWEWLLKPVLMNASEFGLNVATLGLQRFKDSLYKEIAFGFHEEPSIRLYVAVFGLLPAFILGVAIGFFQASNWHKKGSLNNGYDKLLEKLVRPVLVIMTFLLMFSIIQANQLAYINRAVTHFNVLLRIAGPVLAENQRIQYQSQFAQISSDDDYARIITELTEVCHAKNLRTPEFVVW